MSNDNKYFSTVSKIFWGMFVLVIAFALLKLNPKIFNDDNIAENIILEDSLASIEPISQDDPIQEKDDSLNEQYITRTWQWQSFDRKTYTLNFKIKQSDYFDARAFRENAAEGVSDWHDIWSKMYHNDKAGLHEMVAGYRKIIRDNKLSGLEALNMVVSSAQHMPYVLISLAECPKKEGDQTYKDDCRPIKGSPAGCCAFVGPNGVYSPIEYAVNGAGDCDTKSLFACAILKELNIPSYGVEMLTGVANGGPHAMIGINCLNPPYNALFTRDIQQNKYYAWESTALGCELGQDTWETWTNWTVVKL